MQISLHHYVGLLHALAVTAGLLLYVGLTHSGRQRRPPTAAIAWVVFIVAFPYAAIPAFLLFGTRKLLLAAAPALMVHKSGEGWPDALATGLGLPAACGNRSVEFFPDGSSALDALLQLIAGARHSLDLATFILADDTAGRRVVAGLADCVHRGVRVRVLLDGIGHLGRRRRITAMLASAGVGMRWFQSAGAQPRWERLNLRNHRKLVIADGMRLWTGGRNLADEYFGIDPATGWADISCVIDGPLARDAAALFEHDWSGAAAQADMQLSIPGSQDGHRVQLVPCGPDRRDDSAYDYLLAAIHRADHRVLAATPYFVPDEALLQALILACKRGVDVCLVIPARSNHVLADIARDRSLRELAAAGGRVLLYPRMLHAKGLVADHSIGFCGSVNLDGRSLFLNFELHLAFLDPADVAALASCIAGFRDGATAYRPRAPGLVRDIVEGFVRSIGFQL